MKHKQKVRQEFRDTVFSRDKHKCVFCNIVENLDAHHITDRNLMPNGGYVKENGITLCPEHHLLAEEYHQGNIIEGWTPNDLYKKIKSSYESAVKASERL